MRQLADSDWQPIASPLDPRVAIGVLVILCLLGIAWIAATRRETRPIAFGLLWTAGYRPPDHDVRRPVRIAALERLRTEHGIVPGMPAGVGPARR